MSQPRVEVYRDNEGLWRWRWLAKNGHVMADSGQGYADKRDCIRGLERVTGGWFDVTYGLGESYQQGTLTRWTGPSWGSRPSPYRHETFVQVLG